MQHDTNQNQPWFRSDSHEGSDKGDKQRMTQFCGKLFKIGQEQNMSNNNNNKKIISENVIVGSDKYVCITYIYKIMASALTFTSHKLFL